MSWRTSRRSTRGTSGCLLAASAGRQADADPGASGIDPLQLSDHARTNVPRWYAEGSAVFLETWMAGGLGRAQGGYDEMVFRAKVRDNDKLYSPLGLESEGIAVDFQIGANDYLYGTRFFSYLALTYGPEKVMQWLRRDDRQCAHSTHPVQRTFGKPLDDVWSDGTPWSGISSRRICQASRLSADRVQHLSPKGLGPCRAASSTSGPTSWSPHSATRARSGSSARWTLPPASCASSPSLRA
jgi:hypothetical protein